MANKLNIYACSGLNDAKAGSYNYWTDGTRTLDNTQAANGIIAKINLNLAKLMHLRNLTREEQNSLIQTINVYTACLYFVRQYANDEEMLLKAGMALGSVLTQDVFVKEYKDLYDAEEEANYIIACTQELLSNDGKINENIEFAKWWKANVLKRNTIGFGREKRELIRKVMAKGISGVGTANDAWQQDADLGEYLTKGSEYFLYLYFTEAQLNKLPKVFRRKAKQQKETYNYCKALFVGTYGSEQEMQDIIRAGIIGYFSATPEDVCADIVSGKREAVGIATEIIVAIIGGLVTIITGVITAVCTMVATMKVAEYKSIDQEAINQSTPNADDFDGLDFGGSTGSVSWFKVAAIGVIAYLFLRR